MDRGSLLLGPCGDGRVGLLQPRTHFFGILIPGLAGRPTASGEKFNPQKLTAAHKKLPFGSCVRVVNMENGRSVEVRVNDRGPYVEGRDLDLSQAAAETLGLGGVGQVSVEVVPAP